MRAPMTSLAALLVVSTAANAQEMLAGGAVPGQHFYCSFFNAGSGPVTLTNVHLRKLDGSRIDSESASQGFENTCDDSPSLAQRRSCYVGAHFDPPSLFVSCRAVVTPNKINVRGVLVGFAGSIAFSTDLR